MMIVNKYQDIKTMEQIVSDCKQDLINDIKYRLKEFEEWENHTIQTIILHDNKIQILFTGDSVFDAVDMSVLTNELGDGYIKNNSFIIEL